MIALVALAAAIPGRPSPAQDKAAQAKAARSEPEVLGCVQEKTAQPNSRTPAWLFTMARHLIVDHYRA